MEFFEMIVALTAIGCGTSVLNHLIRGGKNKKLTERVNQLEQENKQLQERTENMEMLVGGMDMELLQSMMELQALEGSEKSKEKIKQTADKQRQKSQSTVNSDEPIEETLRSIATKFLKKVDTYLDENEKQHPKQNERPWRGY